MKNGEIKDLLRDRNGRPMLATINYEGKDYLTSVSDSTQMSQQLLKGYAKSVGIENLPQITCKTLVDKSATVYSEEHQTEVYRTKQEISNNNLMQIRPYLNSLGSAKDQIIIPMITQDNTGGSAHTYYMAVIKVEGKYQASILNQSSRMEEDAEKSVKLFAKQITDEITKVTGTDFHADLNIINGAFESADNVASCTEIGAPLLDAMINGKLNEAISESKDRKLSLEEIGTIRLKGTMNSHEAGINGFLGEITSLATTVNEDKAVSSEMALASIVI